MPQRRHITWLIVLLILILGLGPIIGYWMFLGRVPTITPQTARQWLTDPNSRAILVDVRSSSAFAGEHLSGAVNWPASQICQLKSASEIPAILSGHKILLICNIGWNSAAATRQLRQLSLDAYSIQGGLQEWTITDAPNCPISLVTAPTSSAPATQTSSFRSSPRYAQWLAVFTGFAIKPTYMLAALILAGLLWRQAQPDMVSLRWGLIFFFLGEAFCAANYLIYGERSYLFEYLHSFGMVLTFAFTSYALIEGMDLRIIGYSHPTQRCAAVTLCHACIKHADVPCGLRRMFLVMIPATMMLAALPLCADFHYDAYTTSILGSQYAYGHEAIHQIYEIRYLPLAGLTLLAGSWLVLWRERHPVVVSKVLFAAALGALGFSYFRLMLLAPFADNQVWFASWEEITELLYVLAVTAVLRIFRHSLMQTAATA